MMHDANNEMSIHVQKDKQKLQCAHREIRSSPCTCAYSIHPHLYASERMKDANAATMTEEISKCAIVLCYCIGVQVVCALTTPVNLQPTYGCMRNWLSVSSRVNESNTFSARS